jgi:predicted DNA-binding protein
MMTIPVYLERQILTAAHQNKIAPDKLVEQAIIEYLDDLEDIAAIELAKKEIERGESRLLTLAEFKKELNELVD